MKTQNSLFNSNIILKPWGEEYVICAKKNKFAITYLKIKPGKKTSLHCHSKKKTGFIILEGKATVQIGIYKKNTFKYNPLSRLVFRPGLFHQIQNKEKKNLYALEFEAPYIKNDLIRLNDDYGRSNKRYEGKRYFKPFNKNTVVFEGYFKNDKYKLNKKNIYLNEIRKSEDIKTKGEKSSIAILDGRIIDKFGQIVIQSGEIIKSDTLRVLLKKFKIKTKLIIFEVSN